MFFESIYQATIFSHSVLISEAIGGIVSSDSIVKQIKGYFTITSVVSAKIH